MDRRRAKFNDEAERSGERRLLEQPRPPRLIEAEARWTSVKELSVAFTEQTLDSSVRFGLERGVRGSGVAIDPERVRRARATAGLTLAQVAGGDLSRTFIYQLERGLARPSPGALRLIARRTGRPVSYFLSSRTALSKVKDLSIELSAVATQVRRFIAIGSLNTTEREAMRHIEVSLKQGAAVARSIQRGTRH